MAQRELIDAHGVVWTVTDVVPSMAERRLRDRRVDATGSAAKFEQRRKARRRYAQARAPVTPGFEHGWLTFESAHEKRRLVPVPRDWATLGEKPLAALMASAKAVPKRRGRLVE
jgi:hypothetical protein